MDNLRTEKIRPSRQQDVFITKTATKTLTNTAVVEKVINFHFRDLIKALRTYNSVEISGFGRFTISQNKLHRKLNELKSTYRNVLRLYEEGRDLKSKEISESRLLVLKETITYLESRKTIDETKFQGYLRGMEKSFAASSEAEGVNTAN